jgi:hypothetical protein
MSFGKITNAIPAADRVDRRSADERTFGLGVRYHVITKLPLEQAGQGVEGSPPDDWQATNMHIPFIRQRDGDVIADATLFRLRAYMAEKAEAHKAAVAAAVATAV